MWRERSYRDKCGERGHIGISVDIRVFFSELFISLSILQAAAPSDRAPLQAMLAPLAALAERHRGGKEGFARNVGALETS